MEIPNYEQWFYKTYAREQAESWVGPYGKNLNQNEEDIELLFSRLAQADGEIFTRKVNDSPEPGKGMEWGMLQAFRQPVDIYFAKWQAQGSPKDSRGNPIGYFMFVDGRFCWDSLVSFATPRISHAVFVRPKLIKRVEPVYSAEAAAQHLKGTVRVYINVGPDGVVQVAHALSDEPGFSIDPILTKSAEDAVIQWQFQPGTIDGKPASFNAFIVDVAFPPKR